MQQVYTSKFLRGSAATTLLCLWALACGSPEPAQSPKEIEFEIVIQSNPEDEVGAAADNPITLKPCLKDGTGCERYNEPKAAGNTEPLDPAKRYDVGISVLDPQRGPATARVTLVVFSDFQCPFCRNLELTLSEVMLRFPSDVRVIWKDLPLASHAFARPAALLGREAFTQGGNALFWRVHDELFQRQHELSDSFLQQFATRYQLTWPPTQQYQKQLDETFEQVEALNVRATPTTFVNGRPVVGVQPLDAYTQLIKQELAAPTP